MRLEGLAAFSSRTRFSQSLHITRLTEKEARQVEGAEKVGRGLMRVLNILISVLTVAGLLGFVDVLFKQINFFNLLAEYSGRLPPNVQGFNAFLTEHASIFFPTFIEEELVKLGLTRGEAVILYFLLTMAGSVLFSILLKAVSILLERWLFRRTLPLSASLKQVAVVLEFLPFSILLTSSMDISRYHQTRAVVELSILNFITVWFCLIFLIFTYEQRKRRFWQALLKLSYSLFSFLLGILCTLGFDFLKIVIFTTFFSVLMLAIAVAYYAKKQCHTSLVFLLESLLYLAVSGTLLLFHCRGRLLLLGWLFIALENLFFLLNVAVLSYRAIKYVLYLKNRCAGRQKV